MFDNDAALLSNNKSNEMIFNILDMNSSDNITKMTIRIPDVPITQFKIILELNADGNILNVSEVEASHVTIKKHIKDLNLTKEYYDKYIKKANFWLLFLNFLQKPRLILVF